MKYSKDERIDIGRQVVTQMLTKQEAMDKYDIRRTCMDNYIRLYKESAGIPTKTPCTSSKKSFTINPHTSSDIDDYMAMSKEELIEELIKAKANELRAKKGYEVKGVGVNKEYISLNNKSTK